MFQNFNGHKVYVVDIPDNPKSLLPIYDSSDSAFPKLGGMTQLRHYAEALDTAIKEGMITEAGKYGIEIVEGDDMIYWNVYSLTE